AGGRARGRAARPEPAAVGGAPGTPGRWWRGGCGACGGAGRSQQPPSMRRGGHRWMDLQIGWWTRRTPLRGAGWRWHVGESAGAHGTVDPTRSCRTRVRYAGRRGGVRAVVAGDPDLAVGDVLVDRGPGAGHRGAHRGAATR